MKCFLSYFAESRSGSNLINKWLKLFAFYCDWQTEIVWRPRQSSLLSYRFPLTSPFHLLTFWCCDFCIPETSFYMAVGVVEHNCLQACKFYFEITGDVNISSRRNCHWCKSVGFSPENLAWVSE